MTGTDEVSLTIVQADEAQIMRLFGVDQSSQAESDLVKASAEGGLGLSDVAGRLLGGVLLDPNWIELIDRTDIGAIGGLTGYLQTGYDPPAEAQEILAAAAETAPQYVLLLLSRAFGGQTVTLTPDVSITPLAVVSLEHAPPTAAPMTPETASGQLDAAPPTEKAPMSQARISGMVALAVLIFLAAFTPVLVLISG